MACSLAALPNFQHFKIGLSTETIDVVGKKGSPVYFTLLFSIFFPQLKDNRFLACSPLLLSHTVQ